MNQTYSLSQFKCHKSMRWPFQDHFWSFFATYIEIFYKNLGADVHYERLNMSKSQLDQNL